MSKTLTAITKGLSQERFGAYRRATCGNAAALALYEWNNAISAALWADIAHLEVLVRNTMHEQLTVWSSRTFSEPRWYLDPGRFLAPNRLVDIAAARQRATTGKRGKPETSGRVVAELSFGFWRYLVSSHYDRTLWKPILSRSFPLQPRRKANSRLDLPSVRSLNRLQQHPKRPRSDRWARKPISRAFKTGWLQAWSICVGSISSQMSVAEC